jgi:hypothetical protein
MVPPVDLLTSAKASSQPHIKYIGVNEYIIFKLMQRHIIAMQEATASDYYCQHGIEVSNSTPTMLTIELGGGGDILVVATISFFF